MDLDVGGLVTDRYRIPTPDPSSPEAVARTVKEILDHFEWREAFGCAMPSVVRRGVVRSAANIDKRWIGVDAVELLTQVTGRAVTVLNDADAAGLAELQYGEARDERDLVIVLTFGTGIGSAMFVEGVLVPNTELGHLELNGMEAEHYAAARVFDDDEAMTYTEWGDRVNRYLNHLEMLFSPDRFVIGGGISKQFDEFAGRLRVSADVVPAQLRNRAGIVGAALASRGL